MIIALIDDNQLEQSQTAHLFIDALTTMEVQITRFDLFSSGESFLKHWKERHYDLIILDILMSKMSGIDVAKEIRKHNQDVRIVFCSNSNDYAYESYLVDSSYYIHKPVTYDVINRMMAHLDLQDYHARRFIVLPNGCHMVLRDMLYAKYSNHKIDIHLKNGETISFWSSLRNFMEQLKDFRYFLQCNKGYIVNLHEVKDWYKDYFTMSNQELIPISRKRQIEVREAYHQFLFYSLRENVSVKDSLLK